MSKLLPLYPATPIPAAPIRQVKGRISRLSPAQLARKRAHDREAQRVNRRRTKDQIQTLESELAELRAITSRHDELLAKNRFLEEELRRVQEEVAARSSAADAPSTYLSPLDPDGITTPKIPYPASIPVPYHGSYLEPGSYPTSCPTPYFDVPYRLTTGVTPNPPLVTQQAAVYSQIPLDWNGGGTVLANGLDEPFYAVNTIMPAPSLDMSQPDAQKLIRQPSNSLWGTPLPLDPPKSYHDLIFLTWVQDCRRVSPIWPLAELLSPLRIDVGPLLFNIDKDGSMARAMSGGLIKTQPTGNNYYGDVDPVRDFVLATFTQFEMKHLLGRLTCFITGMRMTSWLAMPNNETFARLGKMSRPFPKQRTIPHSQWIEYIVWPKLRELLIDHPDVYDTPEMASLYAQSVRLANWPKAENDAFHVDAATGQLRVTPEFERFALDESNYRIDRAFLKRYPELGGYVEIFDDD